MSSRSVQSSKIRWRCRRGTKELDHLLLSYFENHYQKANESERVCFEEILSLQDPLLIEMFAHPLKIDNQDHRSIVVQIIGTEEGFLLR